MLGGDQTKELCQGSVGNVPERNSNPTPWVFNPNWVLIHTYTHCLHTYITLHYITLHFITLHTITYHYIPLHYIPIYNSHRFDASVNHYNLWRLPRNERVSILKSSISGPILLADPNRSSKKEGFSTSYLHCLYQIKCSVVWLLNVINTY